MPRYRIGRLEVHEYPVEVDADDMVEAMEKVLNGEGDSVDIDGDTYIETDEDRGITIDQLVAAFPEFGKPEAMQRLRAVVNNDDFVPSIRSIEEV